MAYSWRPQPDPGLDPELTRTFDDQAAAEAWLAEHYEDLRDEGVESVALVEGDRVVYGPMSLAE